MKKFIFCFSLFFSTISQAWDGVATGYVSLIQITAAENYGFRVSYEDGSIFCNGFAWAYLNKSNSNYETYISAILAAKLSRTQITVHVTKDSNGYCNIGHLNLL